jgi:hypothetical protein
MSRRLAVARSCAQCQGHVLVFQQQVRVPCFVLLTRDFDGGVLVFPRKKVWVMSRQRQISTV